MLRQRIALASIIDSLEPADREVEDSFRKLFNDVGFFQQHQVHL